MLFSDFFNVTFGFGVGVAFFSSFCSGVGVTVSVDSAVSVGRNTCRTALALADSLNEAMDNQYHYVYDRSQKREMRDEKEIGISAVRGGTIVGEHEVIFAGEDEVIEFKHTAYSKAIFGKGAIEAAKFLAGKPAGKYDMADVIEG